MAKNKDVDLFYACKLKPQDAIRYFEDKGYTISWDWHDTWQNAHAKAFTVAKMTEIDLLQDTKAIVQKAIDEGWSEQRFIKEAAPMLKSKGWWGKDVIRDENGNEKVIQKGSAYRLKTIYRTNLQTAYMAGRYKQQLENVDIEPYWQYVAVLDSRTRPEHRELNGKVFRYDDPFWDSFYPPNGWGCRCRVRALDDDYLKENNLKPESSEGKISQGWALVSKETGEARPISVFESTDILGKKTSISTDAGWSYNVGKAAWNIDVLAYEKIKNLSPEIKAKFISEMAQNVPRKQAFAGLIDSTIQNSFKPKGIEQSIGWMNPDTLSYLDKNDLMPQTPVIVMQDKRIGHILGDRKKQDIPVEELKKASEIISNPDAVYFDKRSKSDPTLLYIKKLNDKEILKFVVKVNRKNKSIPVNYASTAGIIKPENLRDPNYILIK